MFEDIVLDQILRLFSSPQRMVFSPSKKPYDMVFGVGGVGRTLLSCDPGDTSRASRPIRRRTAVSSVNASLRSCGVFEVVSDAQSD